jgi:predicted RNase H-like HicB family nuclease
MSAYASGMSQIVRFTATITPDEEGWYVARCVQVEVSSQGRTVDEALANLTEALELYFEDEPIPEIPRQPIVAPVEVRLSA